MDRDDGQDKTDWAENDRLAEECRKGTGQMPFYESEPPIYFMPIDEAVAEAKK